MTPAEWRQNYIRSADGKRDFQYCKIATFGEAGFLFAGLPRRRGLEGCWWGGGWVGCLLGVFVPKLGLGLYQQCDGNGQNHPFHSCTCHGGGFSAPITQLCDDALICVAVLRWRTGWNNQKQSLSDCFRCRWLHVWFGRFFTALCPSWWNPKGDLCLLLGIVRWMCEPRHPGATTQTLTQTYARMLAVSIQRRTCSLGPFNVLQSSWFYARR